MASIPGENIAPRPGQGLAVVLNNDYTPLRVLQQGDAFRARRAAADALAKQKRAADIAKQWSEDRKLGLDTGGLFQQPFNDYTANAQDIIGRHYADEEAGRITTAQRIQNVANYKNEVERERLLGIDKDKTLATYETSQTAKPFRDAQGLHTAIGESVIGPDGQRVRATSYDERAMLNKLDADPRTYAADPIIGDYYKGLQASTVDEANAGRIGGIHSSSSLTYKGLLPVKRADGTWDVKRDALGRPVIGISDNELSLARASNHNLNMAVGRLRQEYDGMREQNPSLPQKSDLELFQQASQKYVSFRQQDSAARNAMPRAAASATKAVIEEAPATFSAPGTYNATLAASDVPYNLRTEDGPLKIDALPGATKEGFQHYGEAPAPKLRKKDGTRVDVESKNLSPAGFYQEDGKGHFNYVPNNKTPLAGGYGNAFKVLVDAKTGRRLDAKPSENADALVRAGKALYSTHLNFYAHKNENYTADLSKLTDELMRETNSSGDPKYQSRARAEIAAKESLEKGRSRKLIPYAENKIAINQDTKNEHGQGYYEKFEAQVQAENARLRAAGPAAPTPITPAPAARGKVKIVGKNNIFGF